MRFVCALVLGSVLVVSACGSGTSGGGQVSPPHIIAWSPRPPTVGGEAAVYAAALRDWQHRGTIRVYDHFCIAGHDCVRAPIPAELRAEVTRLLDRVRFVPAATGAITLDRASVSGTRARLTLQEDCGAMCIHGERLRLAQAGGQWRPVGTRSEWIS